MLQRQLIDLWINNEENNISAANVIPPSCYLANNKVLHMLPSGFTDHTDSDGGEKNKPRLEH